MAEDLELLEAWRGGDNAAGSQLFDRHFRAMTRFFRNKVRSEVEDLVQTTFTRAVESRDSFRGAASFRTFLFAVANNVLRNHYRHHRRHGSKIDFLEHSVHDMTPGPSSLLARAAEERLLLEGLRRIPIDHQVILELYYWEKLNAADIAVVVDAPEGTVRTRIRRAKQLLESAMTELDAAAGNLESTMGNLDKWAAGLREQMNADL